MSHKIWFTSDLHFGHKNVIPYCNRPFSSVEEMDTELIRRWNVLVAEEDVVYVLGDFSFYRATRTTEILSQLKGKKILIRGNHDESLSKMQRLGFAETHNFLSISLDGWQVDLSHYPFPPTKYETLRHKLRNFWKFWRKKKYMDLRYMDRRPVENGQWLLHGHVHEKWQTKRKMINVGVDVWSFAPVSTEEILALITAQESRDR